jgi:hypothetical protein
MSSNRTGDDADAVIPCPFNTLILAQVAHVGRKSHLICVNLFGQQLNYTYRLTLLYEMRMRIKRNNATYTRAHSM